MKRTDIIKRLKKYFKIQELVGPNVYNAHKDESWFVFSTDTLHCLLLMREGLGKPFLINNWLWGGQFDERGFRDDTQPILRNAAIKKRLYLSGHVLGRAFDITVIGMEAEDARNWIIKNEVIFPCKIRLEHLKNGVPISWLHFDTNDYPNNPKIYLFNV
jgi:hypothetical protein